METVKAGDEKSKDKVLPSGKGFQALLRDTFKGWSEWQRSAGTDHHSRSIFPCGTGMG